MDNNRKRNLLNNINIINNDNDNNNEEIEDIEDQLTKKKCRMCLSGESGII